MNRIVGKENCKPGEVGSGGEILDEDSPDAFNGTGTVARSRSNESRIEASREEVQRLHRIISECEFVARIYSVLKDCKPGIDEGSGRIVINFVCIINDSIFFISSGNCPSVSEERCPLTSAGHFHRRKFTADSFLRIQWTPGQILSLGAQCQWHR